MTMLYRCPDNDSNLTFYTFKPWVKGIHCKLFLVFTIPALSSVIIVVILIFNHFSNTKSQWMLWYKHWCQPFSFMLLVKLLKSGETNTKVFVDLFVVAILPLVLNKSYFNCFARGEFSLANGWAEKNVLVIGSKFWKWSETCHKVKNV